MASPWASVLSGMRSAQEKERTPARRQAKLEEAKRLLRDIDAKTEPLDVLDWLWLRYG